MQRWLILLLPFVIAIARTMLDACRRGDGGDDRTP